MIFRYESETEIEEVVDGFEACTTAKNNFPHQSHLTVAVWYLYKNEIDQATEKMREGLFRFLDHHGVGREKYNETLTIFWLKIIEQRMTEMKEDHSLLELTNSILKSLANSRIAFEYYTPAVLSSVRAKTNWIEPDLKKI
ncbi:MAG TPA: hypothetical protein VIV66_00185 [Pyrinomonadaceae bacterium]